MAEDGDIEFSALSDTNLDAGDELQALRDEANASARSMYVSHDTASSHRIAKVGRFATINTNDWETYRDALLDAELEFDPKDHEWFDGIVAEASGIPALQYPDDEKYAEFEPLRDNIACLRNHILTQFFADGSFDKDDYHDHLKLDTIQNIAREMGNLIARGATTFSNPLKASVNFKIACTDGEGAKAIYNEIYNMQTSSEEPSVINDITSFISGTMYIFGLGDKVKSWGLEHISLTPFNVRDHNQTQSENASAADISSPDGFKNLASEINVPKASHATMAGMAAGAAAIGAVDMSSSRGFSSSLNKRANQVVKMSEYVPVDSLSSQVKSEAIEEARKILQGIKITYSDMPISELITVSPGDFADLVQDKYNVVTTFYEHLHNATGTFGDNIRAIPEVQNAESAIYQLAAQTKLYARKTALENGDNDLVAIIDEELKQFSPDMLKPPEQSVAGLFSKVEKGIDLVVAKLTALQQSTAEEVAERMINPLVTNEVAMQAQSNATARQQIRDSLPEQYNQYTADGQQQQQLQNNIQVAAHVNNTSQRSADQTVGDDMGNNKNQFNQQNQQGGTQPIASQQNMRQNRDGSRASQSATGSSAQRNASNSRQQFDKILRNSDLRQMRGSVNAATSGDFSAGAPNSAARVVQDQLKSAQRQERKAEKKTQKKQRADQRVIRNAESQQAALQQKRDAAKSNDASPGKKKDRNTGIS